MLFLLRKPARGSILLLKVLFYGNQMYNKVVSYMVLQTLAFHSPFDEFIIAWLCAGEGKREREWDYIKQSPPTDFKLY